MDKALLKEIILEQAELLECKEIGIEREILSAIGKYTQAPQAVVVSGIRRAGKSTLLKQIIEKYHKEQGYYFNFEDERLCDFKAANFNSLLEVFVELFGERKVFFLDEIQNVENWELFVRRMCDRGFKFYITGSNASLLSREIGARLTGRHMPINLSPFSFREFLKFKGFEINKNSLSITAERGKIKRYFNEYLQWGGMPEFLRYKDRDLLKAAYNDILYRDIAARYEIKEVKALRELSLYFLSNPGSPFSYNKLKNSLGMGSVNTIKSYTDFLENSFLIMVNNQFSYSFKKQIVNAKKVYCVDNGILEAVSFQFSLNRGKYLENIVNAELKREGEEIYYYKTRSGFEIDFVIKRGRNVNMLMQVAMSLHKEETRNRELRALKEAAEELKVKNALILTEDAEEDLKENSLEIKVMPVYKWLLER